MLRFQAGHSPAWGDVFRLALYNPMGYKFQFTVLRDKVMRKGGVKNSDSNLVSSLA